MVSAQALKGCSLFKGFTDTGLQILAGIATERSFPQGSPLFVEGMVSDSLLILSRGRVKIATKSAGGEEIILGELGPNDFLGELSLVHQGQRMCTASAAGEVSAIEIRNSDFQK